MTTENLDTYAKRLAWAMAHAGRNNQSELARAIGVRPQSIQHLLAEDKGASGSSFTAAIAAELRVSSTWLATGEGLPETIVIDPTFRMWDALSKLGADQLKVSTIFVEGEEPELEETNIVRFAGHQAIATAARTLGAALNSMTTLDRDQAASLLRRLAENPEMADEIAIRLQGLVDQASAVFGKGDGTNGAPE